MLDLVEQQLPAVADLCRRYRVRRMDLFGSGAAGTFDPAKSDLDFLVAFERNRNDPPAARYLEFLEELQTLFGRKVDLVDVGAARNPYFIAEALKNRVMVYAA